MPTPKLTNEIIEAAIEGLEAKKLRIDAQINELRAMLAGESAVSPTEPKQVKTRRKFSAVALKRMREAQQRRWAKVRGEASASDAATKAAKPKRKMSAAGRKRIAEAQKKRWAAKRAGSV